MTSPQEMRERVSQHLDRAEALLPVCNPFDPNDTAGLAAQFRELGAACQAAGAEGQAALCEISRAVIDQVARHGVIGPRDALDLARQLVALVRKGASAPAPVAAQAVTPAAPAAGPAATPTAAAMTQTGTHPAPVLPGADAMVTRGLQLIDSRRLGEILVSLSMLTPAQVERALLKQRASGQRFGEALVELDFLSREALDSVLKLQRKRLSTKKPRAPWDPK